MPPQLSNQEEILVDPLRQKFCDILKSNGILEEVDEIIVTEPPELKGEHFASVTVYVKVTFKGRKEKNLFVKKFSSNEAYVKMTKKSRIMEKESFFFMQFLPRLREFTKKYTGKENADLLHFFPKCLHGDDDMIVMENLVLDDNWVMLDRVEKQDLYTTKFALTNLARYHAASYAFIEKECGGSEKFRENNEIACFESFLSESSPEVGAMFDSGLLNCVKILEQFPVIGGKEAIDTLNGFIGNVFPLMTQVVKPSPEDKILVLNHGDCNNNNMLFKKDPRTGKVNNHVLVDLQITRLCSPNSDIGYFLYTSMKPDVRRAHLEEIVSHYFKIFRETLKTFGMKCPISFQEFFQDYKRKYRMGFFVTIAFIAAIAAMKDVNVEDMKDGSPEEMMEMFSTATANWVKSNPEKAKNIATEIVAVIKEDAKLQESL